MLEELGLPQATLDHLRIDGFAAISTMQLRKAIHEFAVFTGVADGRQSAEFVGFEKTKTLSNIDLALSIWGEFTSLQVEEECLELITRALKAMGKLKVIVTRSQAKKPTQSMTWCREFFDESELLLGLMDNVSKTVRPLTEAVLGGNLESIPNQAGRSKLLKSVLKQLVRVDLKTLEYDSTLLSIFRTSTFVNLRPAIALTWAAETLRAIITSLVFHKPEFKDIWNSSNRVYLKGKGMKRNILEGRDNKGGWGEPCRLWRLKQITQVLIISKMLSMVSIKH